MPNLNNTAVKIPLLLALTAGGTALKFYLDATYLQKIAQQRRELIQERTAVQEQIAEMEYTTTRRVLTNIEGWKLRQLRGKLAGVEAKLEELK